MPNLYTPFANGTFESAFPDYYFKSGFPIVLNGKMIQSSDMAYAGTYSARFKVDLNNLGGGAILAASIAMRTKPAGGGANIITIPIGKKYRMGFRFFVPSGSPIADGNALIGISGVNEFAGGTWTDLGGGKFRHDVVRPAGQPTTSATMARVSACLDQWVELTYEWIETSNNYDSETPSIVILVKNQAGATVPIVGSANMITNGLMYVDQGTLDEVIVCDLTFGSPVYTKTDETSVDANDGSITVTPPTSSYPYQYSLDNVSYQSSNFFHNLAPGTYTIYVKDTNPTGCLIQQGGVTIFPASEPSCDLAFSNPAYTVVDESAPGANDGSVTLHATSSAGGIQYAKGSIAGPYQGADLFWGLAAGTYTFYLKDANDCQIQIAVQVGSADVPTPPGVLLIDEKPINEGNFVVWFEATGKMNFNSMDCFNANWDLAQGYRLNKISARRHYVVAIPLKKFTFYINLKDGLDSPDFNSYRLALINNNGTVQTNIAVLKKDTFDDGVHYNIYCEDITLVADTPQDIFKLAIYNQVTQDILLVSNDIEVIGEEDAKAVSNELKHRASFNMYGYRYENLPDFFNTIRLRLYKLDEQSDGDLTQYRGASTGRIRNVSFELDRYIVLEAYYFDDSGHRAMQVFQAHDYILVNDIAYLVKTLYKAEMNIAKKLNKGTIEMYEQAFSQANRYSSAPIVVIGSDDPLLLGDGGGRIKL